MDNKGRVLEIINVLGKRYPKATTAIQYKSPLELLISTILSAQCTDRRVNLVTAGLFKKYKSAEDYANADLGELEQDVRSTGFYRNKARNIRDCCRILVKKYDSEVPKTMVELTQLPGVARKTANIVLSHGFGIAKGIAVDTHVKRVAPRLGLSDKKDPNKIEQDLMRITPREKWMDISDLLILHGRETCTARKPKCPECVLKDMCPSAGKFD
jgi:endonuclease-3